MELFQSLNFILHIKVSIQYCSPIPAGGGVHGAGPPHVFWKPKGIGLRLLEFFDFSNTCHSLKAQIGTFINTALFYLYTTKSIFKPTSGHWIFVALWKVLNKRKAIT